MSGNWWDDFSNNLATDLAPLVAFFGEQPTKQYLSECLTIEDVIIFAAAPMDIITALVSAIRVCGTPSLRAFIGRAQEGAGLAEAELCSSTSRDVCELFSNGGIARVFGRPKILEIVHDPQATDEEFLPLSDERTAGIYSFPEYLRTERGGKEWGLQQTSSEREDTSVPSEEGLAPQKPARFAPNPNLSLKIGIKPKAHDWFVLFSVVGTVLQLFVLVWAGLTRYYFKWLRKDHQDKYAFPLTVAGTILLCLGMGLCAHLMSSKTDERVYHRADSSDSTSKPRMYWVQPGSQILGDQVFDSFGYSDAKRPLQRHITSWKITTKDSSTNRTVWAAVAATSLGFLSQFLGLRASHSSVAVMQLEITLFMTVVRAGLRTQRLKEDDNLMAKDPDSFLGHELDFLALMLVRSAAPGYPNSSATERRVRWRPFSKPGTRRVAVPPKTYDGIQPYLLKPPSVSPGHLPRLMGFHIPPGSTDISLTLDEANCEILRWLSAVYHIERGTLPLDDADRDRKAISAAAKAFFFRSRLSSVTGLRVSGLKHNGNWGANFVSVRDVATILTQAIEDTVMILWCSSKQHPVQLEEYWERAFLAFWPVNCSMGSEFHESSLQMSLSRSMDDDGIPSGPWKADASEIEAVLSLWLWSTTEPTKKLDEDDSDIKTVEPRIHRILSVHPGIPDRDDIFNEAAQLSLWNKWTTTEQRWHKLNHHNPVDLVKMQNVVWWREGNGFTTNGNGPPAASNHQRRFFWWSLLKQVPSNEQLTVHEMPSDSSLILNYAQELYSMFLTTISRAVKDLGGNSQVTQYGKLYGASNETVDEIQSALVTRGLCDAQGAFVCSVPILRAQGLLEPLSEIILHLVKVRNGGPCAQKS